MKSFSDDFTCIRNQNKGFRLIFLNKVTKLNCLGTVEGRKDDILVLFPKSALCMADGGTAVQCIYKEITDGFRSSANHIEILGEVKTFDKRINHE